MTFVPVLKKCEEILNLEKVLLPTTKWGAFDLHGIYTLGVLSKPKYVTISSQQNRAHTLAQSIECIRVNNGIKKLKVAVVGGGFSGVALASKLESFNTDKSNLAYNITLFERGAQLCHLQRMCTIRRLHPNIHKWPAENWFDKNYLEGDVKAGEISWQADTAARVASKFSAALIEKISKDYDGLKIYLSCLDVTITSRSNKFDMSVNGRYLEDKQGEKISAASFFPNIDVIIISTGFGIEKVLEFNNDRIENHSYWRNDSVGQTNLYQNSENYLISGNGDGGIVDLFRLTLEDFSQDETFEQFFPKPNPEEEQDPNYQKFLDSLDKKKTENADIFEWMEHYFGKLLSSFNSDVTTGEDLYNYLTSIIKVKVKENVSCVFHIKSPNDHSVNKIKAIVDNKNITFYNRVLFYFVWALGNVEVVTSDGLQSEKELLKIIEKYNIPNKNVIIRHGIDTVNPLKKFLRDAGVVLQERFLHDRFSGEQEIVYNEAAIKYQNGDVYENILD